MVYKIYDIFLGTLKTIEKIDMYKNTVPAFPYGFAGITILSRLRYRNAAPNIIISSLIKKGIRIHNGISLTVVKLISTAKLINLSARGSSIAPNLDVRLYFLAIYPSNISEIPANKKINPEYKIRFSISE